MCNQKLHMKGDDMTDQHEDEISGRELGSIERELHVDAPPEIVYEVITSPEHLREWWPDDAVLEPVPGAVGELVFGDRSSPDVQIPKVTVADARPPWHFSFRWIYPEDEAAAAGNSLHVSFDLEPSGAGTKVRMTETGFREKGWEVAVLEEQYHDHVSGWDHFLPRLVEYAAGLVAS